MKKNIIISFISLIIIFGVILVVRNIKLNSEIDLVINNLNRVFKSINISNLPKSGSIELVANYKGVHGESYPSDFNYNYYLTDKLTLSNEDGSYSYGNFNFLNYLNKIKSIELNNNMIEKKSNDFYKKIYNIDSKYINEPLNSNFSNIEIIIDQGMINVKKVSVLLDNIIINILDNKYIVNDGKNTIYFNLNNDGYNVNINNIFKLNMIKEGKKDTYSFVYNDKVFYIEIKNNEMIFNMDSTSAIYNSIKMNIIKKENVDIVKTMVKNPMDIPIVRYFNDIEFNIWR